MWLRHVWHSLSQLFSYSLQTCFVKRHYEDTWYKSLVLLNFNICNFFTLFVNVPGWSLMGVWRPDDNFNSLEIEYQHHTSLNMCIMADHVTWTFWAFVKSLFSIKAFKLGMLRDLTQIARFVWPTWGPPGSCRPQVGPMLTSWILLSGYA